MKIYIMLILVLLVTSFGISYAMFTFPIKTKKIENYQLINKYDRVVSQRLLKVN